MTPHNVNVRNFGRLLKLLVDGDVYGQPLFIPGVAIAGKGVHDLLFIATEPGPPPMSRAMFTCRPATAYSMQTSRGRDYGDSLLKLHLDGSGLRVKKLLPALR